MCQQSESCPSKALRILLFLLVSSENKTRHLLVNAGTLYIEESLDEMLIRHMMIKKVVTTRKDITVKDAIKILFKKHVGAIVVTSDEKKCVGIFTERDAIRIVAQNMPLDSPLEEVMTKNVLTVQEDATFEEARRKIIDHEIRHLPVVNSNGKLVGLIAVRKILDDFFKL
jgi:CBS domain-containing protein